MSARRRFWLLFAFLALVGVGLVAERRHHEVAQSGERSKASA